MERSGMGIASIGLRQSGPLNLQLPAQRESCTFHGEECHRGVLWIEKTIERRPAGLHHASKCALGDVALVHLFLDLMRDDTLDSRCLGDTESRLMSGRIMPSLPT